ncbi:MAG: DUF4469 domain-containing protein [Treponema sp.]|jgi:hypothetical protein|nr:DUF4469 domain-containing protein [Treponema sp.]
MSNVSEVLHRIRVKHYPNYLPKAEGTYIAGHKIKVDGDNSDVGVYFVSVADPAKQVKVTGHLAENTSSKVIGVIPALDPGLYKLEIHTQYSSGSFFLKEPRTAVLPTELTVAQA